MKWVNLLKTRRKTMTETLGEKLIRCGWVTNFNVKTLVRLIEEHFSSRIPSTQTPISVNDRLPGPEDCDMDGRCWWFCPPDWIELRIHSSTKDAFVAGSTHWLPYNSIQIPTPT